MTSFDIALPQHQQKYCVCKEEWDWTMKSTPNSPCHLPISRGDRRLLQMVAKTSLLTNLGAQAWLKKKTECFFFCFINTLTEFLFT